MTILQKKTNKHNSNWQPEIPNHPYRMLIIGGFGSEKTNALLNQIKQENDDDFSIIDKIYLYIKNPNETKYHYLIKKHEKTDLENLKNPKILIEYSNNWQDIYMNIEFNPGRKCNLLIVL